MTSIRFSKYWGEFLIGDLFKNLSLKRIKPTFDKKNDVSTIRTDEFNLPLINAKSGNNGIMYYGREEDWESAEMTLDIVNDGAISTGLVYAQPQKTGTLYNAYQIQLINRRPNYQELLFLQRCLQRSIQLKFNYYNKATWERVKQESIWLPLIDRTDPTNYTQTDIDWNFMENYIKQLEADRLQQLEAYLIATGLNDYALNDEEKKILSLSQINVSDEVRYSKKVVEDEQIKFREFKLAASYFKNGKKVNVSNDGLFNIMPTKKKINANTITFGGKYPYVARGESQNGIRGYINFDENYLNPEKTISFGQDTATMFYQPKAYFTGDKIQVFSLNDKYGKLNESIALYLIAAVKRALVNFAWGQSSFALEVISELNVMLPVDKYDRLNLNYMENYIRAVEKLTIKDVVEYKDKMIALTKENI
ncbi:restriction endonuclease subunit S [Lactobacillus salivarius]|uniref:restriction endonuclease subunit S n=1 Tax=Ligilactobacillus salivarius TaxID=1624 RepID=UPI001371A6B6|nr:restriction endonuclease subunit S [Ligilactobacillus salivarius]MYY45267.1 restriction endonuclease subunit S [Ligilactobacillus salivarius]